MASYSAIGFTDGITAVSASNLNHIEAGISGAVPSVGNTSTDIIGYGLHSSTDVGMEAVTHAISIGSAAGLNLKWNNAFGTQDTFIITDAHPAYQLSVNGAGIAWRKSTTNATASGVITWTSYTILGS